jgi:beta-aspartyl-peptidase (threonine type)
LADKTWALIIHGGAGIRLTDPNRTDVLQTLEQIVEDSCPLLEGGGSAVDATERAVYLMEESGLFNAGRGACLTSDGRVELDAGICKDLDLSTGSVAGMTEYAHPITVARFIMEETNMVEMHGDRALKLMELYREVRRENLVTPPKLQRWAKMLAELGAGGGYLEKHHQKELRVLMEHPEYRRTPKIGTVGAVAVDSRGGTSAASSTGGYWLKMPGRIGDTPAYGAGFYADRNGAATATGVGEYAVRLLISRSVAGRMKTGTAQHSVMAAFREFEGRFGKDNLGIIAVDRRGGVGVYHNTEGMGHAFKTGRDRKTTVRISVRQGGT